MVEELIDGNIEQNWEIENPTRIRNGKKVRVFARPKWVRPNGKDWIAVEDLVKITETPSGIYIVDIGEAKIQLKSLIKPTDVKRSVIGKLHFGQIIDETNVPDVVKYEVKVLSGNIKQEGLNWIAAEYDGVKLGLFLDDWKKHNASLENGIVTLDLKKAKAKRGEINLDPTVVATLDSGSLNSVGDTWEEARAATGFAFYIDDGLVQVRAGYSAVDYACHRGFLRFDTSGISSPSAVVLYYYPDVIGDSGNIRLSRLTADYGTLGAEDWDAAEAAVEATMPISEIVYDWNTQSLSPGGINTSGHTCYGLREKEHDVDNVEPDVYYGIVFYAVLYAYNEPYLDITEGEPPVVPAINAIMTTNTKFWGI